MPRRLLQWSVWPLFGLVATFTACSGDGDGSSAASTTSTRASATGTALQTPTAAATSAPADLAAFRQFVEAVNAGNVAGAMAALDEGVIWVRGGQCPSGRCTGKQAVEGEVMRDVANHHALLIAGTEPATGGLNVRVELRNDGTRRANVDRVIQVWALEMKAGKISVVRVANDTSDPATVAFLAIPGGGPGVGR